MRSFMVFSGFKMGFNLWVSPLSSLRRLSCSEFTSAGSEVGLGMVRPLKIFADEATKDVFFRFGMVSVLFNRLPHRGYVRFASVILLPMWKTSYEGSRYVDGSLSSILDQQQIYGEDGMVMLLSYSRNFIILEVVIVTGSLQDYLMSSTGEGWLRVWNSYHNLFEGMEDGLIQSVGVMMDLRKLLSWRSILSCIDGHRSTYVKVIQRNMGEDLNVFDKRSQRRELLVLLTNVILPFKDAYAMVSRNLYTDEFCMTLKMRYLYDVTMLTMKLGVPYPCPFVDRCLEIDLDLYQVRDAGYDFDACLLKAFYMFGCTNELRNRLRTFCMLIYYSEAKELQGNVGFKMINLVGVYNCAHLVHYAGYGNYDCINMRYAKNGLKARSGSSWRCRFGVTDRALSVVAANANGVSEENGTMVNFKHVDSHSWMDWKPFYLGPLILRLCPKENGVINYVLSPVIGSQLKWGFDLGLTLLWEVILAMGLSIHMVLVSYKMGLVDFWNLRSGAKVGGYIKACHSKGTTVQVGDFTEVLLHVAAYFEKRMLMNTTMLVYGHNNVMCGNLGDLIIFDALPQCASVMHIARHFLIYVFGSISSCEAGWEIMLDSIMQGVTDANGMQDSGMRTLYGFYEVRFLA